MADDARVLSYLAANVRRARERQRLTQEELAERAGMTFRYLQKIEKGEVNLSVLRLVELAGALALVPAALLKKTQPLPAPRRGRPSGSGRRRG